MRGCAVAEWDHATAAATALSSTVGLLREATRQSASHHLSFIFDSNIKHNTQLVFKCFNSGMTSANAVWLEVGILNRHVFDGEVTCT